jgi:RND family efflux transporter MFP subunit
MKSARVFSVLVVAGLSACQAAERSDNGLPPALGSGISAPDIPKVADLMKPETKSGAASTSGMSGTGTLYPRVQAELGPKVTGVLRSIKVGEGDTVKKGQVVFQLDSSQASLMVQQAEAQVTSAKTTLRAVDLELSRATQLNARGSLPQATLEQIQARHEAAQNAVSQTEVALSMTRRALSDTVVTAPFAGIVTARHKEPGEIATMMPVTVVLEIQDHSVLELRVRLPEGVLRTLAPGGSLDVSFPAIGTQRQVAVKRINPSVDIATRTIEIIAELDNADQSLKPGMLVNVSVADTPTEASDGAIGSANTAAPVQSTVPTKAAGAAP